MFEEYYRQEITGIHNVATCLDTVLTSRGCNSASNFPSSLGFEVRPLLGGSLIHYQPFPYSAERIERIAEANFGYFKQRAGDGYIPPCLNWFKMSSYSPFIKSDVVIDSLTDRQTIPFSEAKKLLDQIATDFGLSLGKVEYKPIPMTNKYKSLHPGFHTPSLAGYCTKTQNVTFHSSYPIDLSTLLHEAAHALYYQKNSRAMLVNGTNYNELDHSALWCLIHMRLCSIYLGLDEPIFLKAMASDVPAFEKISQEDADGILYDFFSNEVFHGMARKVPYRMQETGFGISWAVTGFSMHERCGATKQIRKKRREGYPSAPSLTPKVPIPHHLIQHFSKTQYSAVSRKAAKPAGYG